MRIIINQAEIEEAIEQLILDQVQVPDHMEVRIDLKATRGTEGYHAFIDIVAPGAAASDRSNDGLVQPKEGEHLGIADKVREAKADSSQPRRRGRPKGSPNKPKDLPITEPAPQSADGPIAIPAVEAAPVEPTTEPAPVAEVVAEQPAEAPNAEPVVGTEAPAPVVEATTDKVDQLIEEVAAEPVTPATDVTEADVSSQASPELAANVTETVAEQAEPEAPEPNSEAALAAEAQATEPAAPAAAPRSLFANLSNPKNEG